MPEAKAAAPATTLVDSVRNGDPVALHDYALELLQGGDKAKGNGERVAVMVALNLAHELLVAKDTPEQRAMALEQEAIQRRINSIEAKLDESLALHQQLF